MSGCMNKLFTLTLFQILALVFQTAVSVAEQDTCTSRMQQLSELISEVINSQCNYLDTQEDKTIKIDIIAAIRQRAADAGFQYNGKKSTIQSLTARICVEQKAEIIRTLATAYTCTSLPAKGDTSGIDCSVSIVEQSETSSRTTIAVDLSIRSTDIKCTNLEVAAITTSKNVTPILPMPSGGPSRIDQNPTVRHFSVDFSRVRFAHWDVRTKNDTSGCRCYKTLSKPEKAMPSPLTTGPDDSSVVERELIPVVAETKALTFDRLNSILDNATNTEILVAIKSVNNDDYNEPERNTFVAVKPKYQSEIFSHSSKIWLNDRLALQVFQIRRNKGHLTLQSVQPQGNGIIDDGPYLSCWGVVSADQKPGLSSPIRAGAQIPEKWELFSIQPVPENADIILIKDHSHRLLYIDKELSYGLRCQNSQVQSTERRAWFKFYLLNRTRK